MWLIVLLIALSTVSFADEYTPVDWLTLTEDGGIKAQVGALSLSTSNTECLEIKDVKLGIATYSVVASKWQKREGDEWADVDGTEHAGQVCGFMPSEPGEYRLVMEVDVSGFKQKLASGNTLIIAGEPETAIEATTWGFIKARR